MHPSGWSLGGPPAFQFMKGVFKVRSRTVKSYRRSYGPDFEDSEMAVSKKVAAFW